LAPMEDDLWVGMVANIVVSPCDWWTAVKD